MTCEGLTHRQKFKTFEPARNTAVLQHITRNENTVIVDRTREHARVRFACLLITLLPSYICFVFVRHFEIYAVSFINVSQALITKFGRMMDEAETRSAELRDLIAPAIH